MFSRRSYLLLLMLALLLIPFSALSAQDATAVSTEAAASGPIVVTDALGRQVTFDQAPQRIVIAGKALFMVADAVYLFPEASSRIVAIGKTAQMTLDFVPAIDPNYKDKTILDGQAGAEQIAASRPDLVLLKSSVEQTLGAPLEALGIPVVYVDFETPEQYARDLATLGQIFQNKARADELIAFFQGRTDSITKALADLSENQKPRVLLLYYNDRNGTVAFNVPPQSFIQTMSVQTAGGTPVWLDANLGKGWTTVTLEQIAAWDADQIYIVSYFKPVADVIAALKADPQWQALRAVKAGTLYGFPADYYSWDQPDPRWILGMTWLADIMHPDLFAKLDMQAEIRGFYHDLYGLDDATYDQLVKPNLSGDLP